MNVQVSLWAYTVVFNLPAQSSWAGEYLYPRLLAAPALLPNSTVPAEGVGMAVVVVRWRVLAAVRMAMMLESMFVELVECCDDGRAW